MRGPQDLISVGVITERRLELDLERLEKDPVWRQIVDVIGGVTDRGEELLPHAIRQYIRYYTVNEKFPHQTPATNGPGDIVQIDIKVGTLSCLQEHQQQQEQQ